MLRNRKVSYLPIIILLIFLVLIAIIQTVRTSVFMSSRNRITLGVLAPHTFVLSYDKKSGITNVIFFKTDAQVTVPGGYGWYRLGSVPLLGSIEHKEFEIARHSMEELVGAPVDEVIVPSGGDILETVDEQFINWFLKNRRDFLSLFMRKYRLSTTNVIDRYFITRAMGVRKDKLVFVDGSEGIIMTKKNDPRYSADKLDLVVKGFLYWTYPSKDGAVSVYAPEKLYSAGIRIGRIIEGAGMKVLDIAAVSKIPDTCVFIGHSSQKDTINFLARYFNCKVELKSSEPYSRGIVEFYLNEKIGILYQ